MKIALFAYHFAEYAYCLGCALAEEHEVLLFMHRENAEQELGTSYVSEMPSRLRLVLQEKRGPKHPLFFRNILEIVSNLKRFKPDVIHAQESLNYAFTATLALFRNCPFVLTIHDHIPHSGANDKVLVYLHRKYLRKNPVAVIVHGEKIREECGALLPHLKGQIFNIPHGPIGGKVASSNDAWEEGTLLFFGRIEKYKGLGYLLDAVDILVDQGVAVITIIAGRGNDLTAYRTRINSDTSYELIERYIHRDEIQPLFERANIIVLPYTDATQSGVVAMALQYGRPIVASNVGSIGEMVIDGVNGILVPPKDPVALAEAIKKIMMDSRKAKEYGENARSLAQGEFSWSQISRKTLEVYRSALHQSSMKGPRFA